MKKNFKEKILQNAKIPALSFAVVLILILVSVFGAELLYQPKEMVKRGYKIAFSKDGKVIKKKVKEVNIALLMKNADIKKGKKIFKKCASCHNVAKGSGNKVGPNLHRVVGRSKAAISSFTYSKAMKSKGGRWDLNSLNAFLLKPKNYVPGTKMGFSGLKKPQDRADVIRYLETQR